MLCLTVISSNKTLEKKWERELSEMLTPWTDLDVHAGSALGVAAGPVVFVDARDEQIWRGLDRKGRALVLVVSDRDPVPEALLRQEVDDVLVHPFRVSEVLGKVRHYEQLLMWNEVTTLNASLGGMIEAFHEDLALAERMQKSRLPKRFDTVKGFHVASRYLAGARSGGDYFDLAESQDGHQLSIVLSDASSYGLSSAVLSSLMGAMVRLSADQSRSCRDVVRAIYNEILATLKETDRLSLFYGIVNRKEYKLRYLNFGQACAFLARKGQSFEILPTQADALRRGGGLGTVTEEEVRLDPSDRLVLLSDGFIETVGGAHGTLQLLEKFREREPVELLNELVYSVKKELKSEEDLPAQDCSALVFQTDGKLIRLAG